MVCGKNPSMSTDMFDLSSAQIVCAPDPRVWPITTELMQVSFDGMMTRVHFDRKDGPDRWPDVTPTGWEGPLQYTIWLFLQINGGWVGSAFVQMWHGREGSGSPTDADVPSRFHQNWFYDQRWRPMDGHGPIQPGEQIGFMVTAGNARNNQGPNGEQRSNVVLLAATDTGVFDFPVKPTVPDPDPPDLNLDPVPGKITLETLHADLQTLIAMVKSLKGSG
jgi:hypothetical protein